MGAVALPHVALGRPSVAEAEDSGIRQLEAAITERHIARGATIARDRKRARNGLVRDAGAVSEPHKSDVRDPGHREKMEPVNDLCSWPKGCLRRFAGMPMGSMQGYTNWCVYPFRVNKAGDRWPKAPRFPKTHDVAGGS